MAAAVRARESGRRVTVLDDNPAAGGQIWRNDRRSVWLERFEASGAELICGARVITVDPVLVERESDSFEIRYEALILATGSRELFLPFPGWTLPNVMGVGGLQALVKSGLPVEGKRVVVAGSGPVLLAVAAYLRKRGAIVPLIVEQAPWSRLIPFAARHPGKLPQAAWLRGFTPYLAGAWVEEAERGRVRVRQGAKVRIEPCDYLAVGYGFWPNNELGAAITGTGGVDLAIVEGEIAGYMASGQEARARKLFGRRDRARRFARALDETFALRDELRALPTSDTIVCRCEDVTFGRLQTARSWREAKLHKRCGMGPCQGRICGPAAEFLFGWKHESVRPPVFPARVASLISEGVTQ